MNKDGSDYKAIKLFTGVTFDDTTSAWGLIFGPIAEGSDGLLYGAVYMSGATMGSLFKMNKDGTEYSVLKRFQGNDGQWPHGGLVEGPDGTLYGTTEFGGVNGFGTLFRIWRDGSYFSVLHHFATGVADGILPRASLTVASNGWLYGTTFAASNSWGTVFRINTNGSGYGIVRSFTGTNGDGRSLSAALLLASDGGLYGTTEAGGSNGLGTVFKLRTDGSGYSVIKHFQGSDGQMPQGKLAEGTNGALYGMTKLGGANSAGVAFRLNRDGSDYRVLYSFGATTNDGVQPYAGLLAAKDGALYGTTYEGGDTARGTIFRIRELSSREPLIFTQPTNVTVCAGSTVTFSVEASGHWPFSYRWRLNTTNLVGMDPTLTLPNVRWTNGGRYDCLVSNIYGCATSMVAVLTVIEQPTITRQPQKQIVSPGESATFNVEATNAGCGLLTYQWRFNGDNIPGAIYASYTRTNCQWTDEGTYDVMVSNGCGTNMACGTTNSIAAILAVRASVPGSLLWTAPVTMASAAALGEDGTVYATSGWSVFALDGETGNRKWVSSAQIESGPAVGPDGSVYGAGPSVHRLDAVSGTSIWTYYMGQNPQPWCAPAVGADGTVYVGSYHANMDAALLSLDGGTGAKRWEYALGRNLIFYGAPAIGQDGTVYFAWHRYNEGTMMETDRVVALAPETGARRWELCGYGYSESSPAIGADGTVYVGFMNKLCALDGGTGIQRWEFAPGHRVVSAVAIGVDGTVYVVFANGKLYALNGTTGTKKWDCPTGGDGGYGSCPAIAADGTIYVGSTNGKVYAFDSVDGRKLWEFQAGGPVISSPVIGANGTVYIGSVEGHLYALYGGSPPANSPWPMFGHDAQHTGRAAQLRPGPISLSKTGGQATLRWSGNFMLQSASEVTGPWADLTGAINVYRVTPTAPRQFFRLRSN